MSLDHLLNRLERLTEKLETLLSGFTPAVVAPSVKPYYSVEEAAALLQRSPYTVREYCRLGSLRADKANLSCGLYQQWRIAVEELHRFMRDGKQRAGHV